MKKDFETTIVSVCQKLFSVDVDIQLTRPEEQFGDYATNVALQLAKSLAKNPREVAEIIVAELRLVLAEQVSDASIAGPGFINLRLNDNALSGLANEDVKQSFAGQIVVTEYSDPNPFKVLHAGHIYTTVVGDAIANLFEVAGADVRRVNFGGDVGLHVGRTMWSILQELGGENPEKLDAIQEATRAEWVARHYIAGTSAYDEDEVAKAAIIALNKRVYQLHSDEDHSTPFAQIYWTCRQWSYEAFDAFYARLGTSIEKYYPESEVAQQGLQAVKDHIGDVFEESEGAVVFKAEKYGLHTRVFINREGLPTYEAQDVGLIAKKFEDYHFDRSVVVTANEQHQYMMVVLKAIEQFWPELAQATTYVPHGMVKLAGGMKMSSRKGNIIRATDVLDLTGEAIRATGRQSDETVIIGAIKYAFLKTRIGGDVIYDPAESVSLEGNSGPYLQYAHARARSILRKAVEVVADVPVLDPQADASLEAGERTLLRKISEYSEVVDKAVAEITPHLVCTYLYELAQTFNRFYESNHVVGDPRQELRLSLVRQYADVLRDGLGLLGITAPEKM